MEGYELTDRGKIVITVVLVVLLLFLPAAILLYTAVSSQPSQLPDNQDSHASVSPPSSPVETSIPPITESPPPNGGGFYQPDISAPDTSEPNGNSPEDTPSPNGQDPSPSPPPSPSQPSGSGQGRVDPVAGKLSFLFYPNLQSALDAETSSMLDVFLSSPKNTQDSIIAVETPQLSSDVFDEFIPVVSSAFTQRGVMDNRIAFIIDPSVPLADGSFEVNMSYVTRPSK